MPANSARSRSVNDWRRSKAIETSYPTWLHRLRRAAVLAARVWPTRREAHSLGPGQGSEFEIRLPASDPPVIVAKPPATLLSPQRVHRVNARRAGGRHGGGRQHYHQHERERGGVCDRI